MSKVIDLRIQTTLDNKGLTAAEKAIVKLMTVSKQSTGLSKSAAADAQALSKMTTAANTAAISSQKLATAQHRTEAALAQATAAKTRAERAALSLAQAQTKAAESGSYFSRIGNSVRDSLLGVVAPAAAVTAVLATATRVANSFGDAFDLKARMDATTFAVNAQLKGVRDSNQVWSEATAFGQRYKLTQQEVTEAISASIGVMRASKAPAEDVLGVLARMQVLSPEQSLQEAAIALKALASGDTQSIVTRFEVSRDTANQMKQEILGGADAVAVMDKFLNQTGITMDVLKAKTEGAMGAQKDLAKANEQLALAQAKWAEGPGITILQAQTTGLLSLTKQLTGDFQAVDAANRVFLDTLMQTGSVTEALAARNAFLSGTLDQQTGATATAAAAHRDNAQGMADEANAVIQLTAVTQADAEASLMDAAAKETEAAQTELLQYKIKAAADEFLALNPNITQSGLASAVAAGQISQAVAQYIAMRLESARARAELAALQAQAGVSPALKAAAVSAGGGDVGRYITTPVDPRAKAESEAAVKRLRELRGQEKALIDARRDAVMTNGTAAQQQAQLNKEYSDAARIYGENSVQAVKAKTALDQFTASQVKATSKGGAARVSAAEAASDKLATIEQNTGDKIIAIAEDTAAKLAEIDAKAAAARAAAARQVDEQIALSAADRRARDEVDDLELIGVKDKQQAAALNDRERAQAASRQREADAAKEAQALVAAGEAEAAKEVYNIRESQISAQQALDTQYAEKQRELSGNPEALAALQQQYDEGTRAIAEAADRRIGIEMAASAQRKQAIEDEKAAVVAAAEDQKNQVIGRAQQSAEGVKKASGDARAKAVADLQAIGSAVNAIPTSKTITITTVQTTSSSGGGGTKSAGGGLFMTSGPARLTVGDNPGGMEMVSVTPISGTGRTTVGANMMRLGGGGTVVVDAGSGYTTPVAGSGGGGGKSAGKGGGGGKSGVASMVDATKAMREQIAFIKATTELAYLLKSPIPTIDTASLQAVAAETKRIGAVVGGLLVPITKENMEKLDAYDKAVKGSVSILLSVQNARKELGEVQPPIDPSYVLALAADTRTIGKAIGGLLVPIAQTSLMELADYDEAVSGAVSILKNVQDVRKDLAEPQPPLDPAALYRLAVDAQRASNVIASMLIPYSEDQVDQMGRYADAVSSSASVFKSISEVTGKLFTDYTSPTDAQIMLFAKDAERITRAMATAASTFDTKGLEAAKLYNEAVGGTFANIKDGLLAAQALNSGDFVLDPAKLTQFETTSLAMIASTERLAVAAKAIPAQNLAALGAVTSAISNQAEALIRMAAVPFGDLPGAASGFAASGGAMGSGGPIVNIYNPPASMDVIAVARQVKTALTNEVYARR